MQTLPLPSLAARQTQLCLAATEQHLLFWQLRPAALHFFGRRWHTSAVCQSHICKAEAAARMCGVQLHMCGHQLPLTLVTPLNPRLNKQSNPTATTNFVFRLIQCQPIYLHQQERLDRKSDAPGKSEDRIQSRKQAAERRLFRPWHETQSYATRLNPSRAENEHTSGKVFNVWCTSKNTKLFIIWS